MRFLSLIFKVGADATGFQIGMKKAETIASRASKNIGRAIGAAFSAAALADMTRRVVQFADQMDGLSKRFNATAEEMQVFAFAAKQANTDINQLATSFDYFRRLRQNIMFGGNKEEMGLLESLGISKEQLGQQRIVDSVKQIFSALRSVDLGDNEGAIMQRLFGRSGAQLLELANEDLGAMEDQLRKIGGVIDNETNAALARMNDQVVALTNTFKGPFAIAVSFVADKLNKTAGFLGQVAAGWGGFFGGLVGGKSIDAALDQAAEAMNRQMGINDPGSAALPLPTATAARSEAIMAALRSGASPATREQTASTALQQGNLASVGGFFGLGGTREGSVNYLKKIERNTDKTAAAVTKLVEDE